MCQLKSLLLDTTPVVQTAVASPTLRRGARGRSEGGEEARAAHARRKSRGRKKKPPCREAQAGRKDGGRTRAQKKTSCPLAPGSGAQSPGGAPSFLPGRGGPPRRSRAIFKRHIIPRARPAAGAVPSCSPPMLSQARGRGAGEAKADAKEGAGGAAQTAPGTEAERRARPAVPAQFSRVTSSPGELCAQFPLPIESEGHTRKA